MTNSTDTAAAPAAEEPACLIVSGPTGVGKTALAVELARRGAPIEIISADSMQIYRGLELGTAQPTAEERAAATFHLCGELAPDAPFSVQRFLERTAAAHAEIRARGRVPVYVGGTGLYLRALRWGLFDQPGQDPELRTRLEAEIRDLGPPALHDRLRRLDPAAAEKIAPSDPIRIVRALEVLGAGGKRLSELQTQWQDAPGAAPPTPRFPHHFLVLTAPRDVLRRRIELRMRTMLEEGWVDEVRALLAAGHAPGLHCFKALGYREIIAQLNGEIAAADLPERIIAQTWQFARRQLIWLRRERPALWLLHDPAIAGVQEGLLERVMRLLEVP